MERPQKPVTLADLGREIADEFLSLDRGLPYTFVQLFIAPGATMRRWVEARDARITRPARYFLIATTMLATVAYLLRGRFAGPHWLERDPKSAQLFSLSAEHLLFTKVATVAIGALVLWLVFRRRPTTLVEAIIVSGYSGAQLMWVNAAFILLVAPTGSLQWLLVVGSVAALGYTLWAWGDYFGRRVRDFALALLALLLTQFMVGVVALAAVRLLADGP